MDIGKLNGMVAEGAALRRRQVLQPVGGKGDKIFPPTYPPSDEAKRANPHAPPRHVYERRRVNGTDTWCVLIDSVQSQANRLEDCLLGAIADGIPIPHVEVDFTEAGLDGITKITSLDAPHRVYDAILRDSLYNGTPFMKSDIGQRLHQNRQGAVVTRPGRCGHAFGNLFIAALAGITGSFEGAIGAASRVLAVRDKRSAPGRGLAGAAHARRDGNGCQAASRGVACVALAALDGGRSEG